MSKSFSKILIAFDGTEGSVMALKTAEQIAKLYGASLTVAYVHNEKSTTYENYTPGLNPMIHEPASPSTVNSVHTQQAGVTENTSNNILSDAESKLSGTSIEVNYQILTGEPAKNISKFAKDKDIDLIVIGSRGHRGVKKLVLGSVSNKVTNDSHCPVLVIK